MEFHKRGHCGQIFENKMKSLLLASILAAITICAVSKGCGATERWADAQLPVKSGLVLWLDASRQNAARQARQLPALSDNGEMDFWFDGSGHGVHVSQGMADARPHFRVHGGE